MPCDYFLSIQKESFFSLGLRHGFMDGRFIGSLDIVLRGFLTFLNFFKIFMGRVRLKLMGLVEVRLKTESIKIVEI